MSYTDWPGKSQGNHDTQEPLADSRRFFRSHYRTIDWRPRRGRRCHYIRKTFYHRSVITWTWPSNSPVARSDQKYIYNARSATQALGTGQKKMHQDEVPIKAVLTTSVVSTTTIPKDTIITQQMVTAKRPGTGIPANQREKVIGKKTMHEIAQDQLILSNQLI